jgi:hypothetical protein
MAASLNEKLKPIAEAPVDTTDPNWMERMRRFSPLDEAGVRPEAESLLMSLLDAYASGTTEQRDAIRELFRKNSAFRWATTVRQSAATAEGFRLRLLRLSVLAGIEDPRDLSLNLKDIMETAEAAGVAMKPILAEVAALSESPLREVLSGKR